MNDIVIIMNEIEILITDIEILENLVARIEARDPNVTEIRLTMAAFNESLLARFVVACQQSDRIKKITINATFSGICRGCELQTLADIMRANTSITEISLFGLPFDNENATNLSNILQHSSSLLVLHISSPHTSEIMPDTTQKFIVGLACNKTLRKLEFLGFKISANSLDNLLAGLRQNSGLSTLNIISCIADWRSLERLQNALQGKQLSICLRNINVFAKFDMQTLMPHRPALYLALQEYNEFHREHLRGLQQFVVANIRGYTKPLNFSPAAHMLGRPTSVQATTLPKELLKIVIEMLMPRQHDLLIPESEPESEPWPSAPDRDPWIHPRWRG